MADNHVRPNVQKVTDDDVQKLVSHGMITGECQRLGPSRVAAIAGGMDEKTVRRARDRRTTLGVANTLNLLDADDHVLDALLAAKGKMLVPLFTSAASDVIPTAGAAIHRIGSNRSPGSPGGTVETDAELLASEAENDALLAAVLERRASISQAKLRIAERAA